jgi:hypothetical protein
MMRYSFRFARFRGGFSTDFLQSFLDDARIADATIDRVDVEFRWKCARDSIVQRFVLARVRALSYVHSRSSMAAESEICAFRSIILDSESWSSLAVPGWINEFRQSEAVVGEGRDDLVAGDENVKGGHRGRDFAVVGIDRDSGA